MRYINLRLTYLLTEQLAQSCYMIVNSQELNMWSLQSESNTQTITLPRHTKKHF